jgi:hypothetical protein
MHFRRSRRILGMSDLPLQSPRNGIKCSLLQSVRRFYRSGAGARSLTEVVAAGIKKLEPVQEAD